LEYTVHYKNRGWVPATVLGRAEIPDALKIEALDPNSLREDWAEPAAPNELQEIGKRWIQAGATAVLKVPSATVQSEWNYLLNPRHPDFRRIQVNQPEVYILDSRLARARRK
jgi:RES domain-containing protein